MTTQKSTYAKNIINFSELSRRLTGHRDNIKPEIIPKRFKEPIAELEALVEGWFEKYKDLK